MHAFSQQPDVLTGTMHAMEGLTACPWQHLACVRTLAVTLMIFDVITTAALHDMQ